MNYDFPYFHFRLIPHDVDNNIFYPLDWVFVKCGSFFREMAESAQYAETLRWWILRKRTVSKKFIITFLIEVFTFPGYDAYILNVL